MALPAFVAAAPAIDRYLVLAGPTAANLQQRIRCCEPMLGETDGRTDEWTLYRLVDPAPPGPHRLYAGSADKFFCIHNWCAR